MSTARASAALDLPRGGLIVSVQAPPESPLAEPLLMAAMARAVVAGGADGIRAEGVDDIAAIRAAVDVPIIGLRKRDLPGSPVRITPTLDDALAIAAAGADVVAVDATLRPRPDGAATTDFLATLVRELDVPVLADVDTLEAGISAVEAGVAAVATTLSGYTDIRAPGASDELASDEPDGAAAGWPDVAASRPDFAGSLREVAARLRPDVAASPRDVAARPRLEAAAPDLPLLRALVEKLDRPVLAEGRYGTPAAVRAALDAGAHAVVVGTAITDPFTLTRRFAAAARPEEAHVRDR